jgi:hypothetical protein
MSGFRFDRLRAGADERRAKQMLQAKVAASAWFFRSRNGRGERIRTSDPLLPKQVRYQTALRPELWC